MPFFSHQSAGKLTSPNAVLGACRPALGLITAISAAGALVAINGLRRCHSL